MSKETIDTILAVTQIVGLIALIIYVFKTWQIASATREAAKASEMTLHEMKQSRDQESAPYVVTYFDMPTGEHVIYFVIKNIGRSVATNVRISLEPKLINHSGEDFSELPLVKQGIASLPPNYEIKTFFDTSMSVFGQANNLPLTYNATVRFYGGLQAVERKTEQVLDLSAHKGLSWISRKGMHDLANDVEKIAKSVDGIRKELSEVVDNIASGLHLRNSSLMLSNLSSDLLSWKPLAIAKLLEFKHTWQVLYGGDNEKLLDPFLSNLKLKAELLCQELISVAAIAPNTVNEDTKNAILAVASSLSEMSNMRFYLDGGQSINRFDERGNATISLIDKALQFLK